MARVYSAIPDWSITNFAVHCSHHDESAGFIGTHPDSRRLARGVAILLVLLEHFRPFGSKTQDLFGQHGVTIFFVLSGFLITRQLVGEQSRTGHINLAQFYKRRFFRLKPCAWAFLALMLLFAAISRRELLGSVFFYRNQINGSVLTQHFWSLSLEEQFYLLWPVVLLARRRAAWVAGACVIALSLYRYFRTEVRADALLVGCLLALVWSSPTVHKIANRFMALPLLFLFAGCVYHFHNLVPLFECVVIALLIAAGLADRSPLGPLLKLWPLRVLGTLSYGIYVWQQPFFFVINHDARKLLMLLFLIPIVLISYFCIERPCVRFAHHSTHPTSRTPAEAHQIPA